MTDWPYYQTIDAFYAVFFFITCLIFLWFYTWAAWRAYRLINPGKCRECCWSALTWGNKYEDNRDYLDNEMPTDWVLYHFMLDINILKPLACFHYVVYFYKWILLCTFLIAFRNDVFTMLTLLLLLNLFSFLWACLVRPFKSTINNWINIWMEFCMLVISMILFPLAFKWTPWVKANMYA